MTGRDLVPLGAADRADDELRLDELPLIADSRPDEEPGTAVSRHLLLDERLCGQWRRHPAAPTKALLVVAAYTALLVILVLQRVKPQHTTTALTAVGALGVLAALWCLVDWSTTRLALTDRRLLLVRGVLTRRVSSLPLDRVADLHHRQSPLGRMLGYGTLRVEAAARRGGLRRITDLPRPDELHLRIVEQRQTPVRPSAAPARAAAAEPAAETPAIPLLVNYRGWVSLRMLDGDVPLVPSGDRRLRLHREREYRLVVTVSPEPGGWITEPLAVTGGADEPVVLFEIEVDSDRPELRRPAVPLWARHDGAEQAVIGLADCEPPYAPAPWLLIRVSQHRRTLQTVILTVDYTD